jgi:hypothetical protein
MSELTAIARLPQVKSAVLSDAAGGLVDVLRNSDGESVAAVMGFVTTALVHAGEHLGLGRLRKVTCVGGARVSGRGARGLDPHRLRRSSHVHFDGRGGPRCCA